MAFELGIFTDLDDSVSIADPRVLVAASAIQLPFNKGVIWEDARVMTDPTSNRKFEIYSRSETARGGALDGAIDDTVTTWTVDSTAGLLKGLVLKIEDEIVVIDTVASSTSITVRARGAGGTTAASHADNTTYAVIGSAIDDIDLKDISSVSEVSLVYENYFQTVAEPIDFTKGGMIDPRKGLSQNQIDIMEQEAMLRVAKNISSSVVLGQKQQKDASNPWMTAGLLQQLSDATGGRLVSTYDAAGVLTEAKLKAALRIVTQRGTPTTIYTSYNNKDTMNDWLVSATNAIRVNTELTNTTVGNYVDTYNYEGLLLQVKVDVDVPDDQIPIVNMNNVYRGWKQSDELVLEDQTTLSSREMRRAYNGSFGFAVENVGYEHILMTGITQS